MVITRCQPEPDFFRALKVSASRQEPDLASPVSAKVRILPRAAPDLIGRTVSTAARQQDPDLLDTYTAAYACSCTCIQRVLNYCGLYCILQERGCLRTAVDTVYPIIYCTAYTGACCYATRREPHRALLYRIIPNLCWKNRLCLVLVL